MPKSRIEILEVDSDEEDEEEEVDCDSSNFEPSSTFTGARPGWEFKTGQRGTGYYRAENPGDSSVSSPDNDCSGTENASAQGSDENDAGESSDDKSSYLQA